METGHLQWERGPAPKGFWLHLKCQSPYCCIALCGQSSAGQHRRRCFRKPSAGSSLHTLTDTPLVAYWAPPACAHSRAVCPIPCTDTLPSPYSAQPLPVSLLPLSVHQEPAGAKCSVNEIVLDSIKALIWPQKAGIAQQQHKKVSLRWAELFQEPGNSYFRNKLSTFTRHTKSQINLYQHVNFTGFEEKWPLSRNGFSTFAITALAFHWNKSLYFIWHFGICVGFWNHPLPLPLHPPQNINTNWIYALNKCYTQKHTCRIQVKLFHSPILQKTEMQLHPDFSDVVIANPEKASKSFNLCFMLYRGVPK